MSVGERNSARGPWSGALPGGESWVPHVLDAVVGCAVIQLDPSGKVVAWNAGAAAMFEYSPREIIGRHVCVLHVAGPAVEASIERQFRRARETGCVRETGWRVTKNGRQLWIDSSIDAVRSPDGALLGFVKLAHDATAQFEALERQRVLVESTAYAVLAMTEDGVITVFNPAAERLLGYRASDVLHTHTAAAFHVREELAQRSKQLTVELGHAIEAGADALVAWTRERGLPDERQWTYVRKDGSLVPVSLAVTAMRAPNRELTGYMAIVRDVTEQKAAQAERDRLLSVIESASDFVGIADPHGNIVYQNAAANRVLGLPDDADVRGLHVSEMHPPWAAARIVEHALPAARRDGSYTHDTVLRGVNGQEVPVSQLLIAHRNAAGEVEYTSTIMRDLRNQRKAEALLAKVASQVRGMLYQLESTSSGATRFVYVSPGSIELYGVAPEALVQNAGLLRELLDPEDAERLRAAMRHSAETLTPWHSEYRVRGSKGELRWHRGQAVPERTPDGTTLWHGFVTDVTDAKVAEEESRRRKAELEGAIAALDAGFAMYDAEERLVVCNDRYAEMFFINPHARAQRPTYEELVRSSLGESGELRRLLPPIVDVEQWIKKRLLEFRSPSSSSLQRHGERWIRIDDRKTPNGGTVCMRTDVTAIKRAEFEAKLQEERLKLATSAAGIGIWELDVVQQKLSWDQRMFELHACSPADFQGTYADWRSRIHPDDAAQVEGKLKNAIEHGEGFRAAFRVVGPDGAVRHLESRSGCIRSTEGAIVRVIGVTTDITEQIEAQQTLQAAADAANEASKAKAEFLATMSHEIRTPMNGVIGMTNLLIGTELDGVQREYVETIRASGESLLTLINDILDFSKMEAGKLVLESVPFCLDHVVMECITLFTSQAESKGVALVHQLPPEPTHAIGDPTRVKQLLLNLVSNALKFTKVGSVRVIVGVERTSKTRAMVEMRVADTGIGMAPDHLNRLGEAFLQADASTTRQYGGTGLGLSICRSLITLLNGKLTVESELGKGTTFTVRLPLELTERAEIAAPLASANNADFRLKRVLVAEDNSVNQRVVGLLLKKIVDVVDFASDGREALELFTLNSYDCVLMDGQMPEMDGLEATRRIRAVESLEGRHRTPIIALTANALPGDRETFLRAGMDEYLTKPVRSGDLTMTLAKLCPNTRA